MSTTTQLLCPNPTNEDEQCLARYDELVPALAKFAQDHEGDARLTFVRKPGHGWYAMMNATEGVAQVDGNFDFIISAEELAAGLDNLWGLMKRTESAFDNELQGNLRKHRDKKAKAKVAASDWENW